MKRPVRGVLIGLIGGMLGAALVVPVSAGDFALNHWISMNLNGYKHPPTSYTVGDTFSFSFNLRNDQDTARTQCLEVQIFRLTTLSADATLTEPALEALVHAANTQQVLVKTLSLGSTTFPAFTTKPFAPTMALNFGTGIFQFDTGPCGQDLSPGKSMPFNSGFIRVIAAPVVPTPPTSAPTSGSGVSPNSGALTLAATGSGAQPEGRVSWLAFLLWMGLLAAAGLGLVLRRVR